MYLIKTFTTIAILCFAAFVHAEVNINTATVQQFTELNNIGAVKAAAIVEYRTKYGRFQSVEDLLKVNGIGMAILEQNRNMLTVGISRTQDLPSDGAVPVEQGVMTEAYVPNTDKDKNDKANTP